MNPPFVAYDFSRVRVNDLSLGLGGKWEKVVTLGYDVATRLDAGR
jgi:hypothetical protein